MTLRACVLIGLMTGLFGWLGSLFGAIEAAIALSAGILACFWSYWSAAPDFLARTGARQCSDPRIIRLTSDIAKRAEIPVPPTFIFEDDQPNAITIGPNRKQSILVLTTALLAELGPDELAAVIAHELAHIRNRDVLAATLASTFLSAISGLAIVIGLLGFSLRRNGGSIMIAFALAAPLVAIILRVAMSRSTEYRADRDAALLCGDPRHLISALRCIGRIADRASCQAAVNSPAYAPLFFVDPFGKSWLAGLFSAHPPIHRRIARLEAMPPSGCDGWRGSGR